MALIVENGTGMATAESYVSVADYDAYHLEFGFTTLGTTPEKEADLRKGTRYVDILGQRRWIGVRREALQALDWPRSSAEDDDGYARDFDAVPIEVIQATCEAAKRAHVEELLPDIAANGMILSESKTLGPISKSVTYMGGKSPFKRYTIIDKLLSPLLTASGILRRA